MNPRVSLPAPIYDTLAGIEGGLRTRDAARNLGTLGLVLAIGLSVAMALDFLWSLPAALRWVFWLAGVGAVGLVLVTGVIRPLLRRISEVDVAAVAERLHPDLGDRLTSTVDLLTGRGPAHGSAALIAALAEETTVRIQAADLGRTIALTESVRRMALGAAALATVAILALVWPDPLGIVLGRTIRPWAAIEPVGWYQIDVEPGNRVVAQGSNLTIQARVRPRFGRRAVGDIVQVEWSSGHGAVNHAAMRTSESELAGRFDRAFSATLPPVSDSLVYRVRAGAAASRQFRITVVEAPAVLQVRAAIDPPGYTKLPARLVQDAVWIEAWEGSRIVLDVTTSKPVRQVKMEWPRMVKGTRNVAESLTLELTPDRRSATIALAATRSGPFSFTLRDEFGIESRPEPTRRLTVRPDRPPSVAWTDPKPAEDAAADDVLRAGVLAGDDLGVAAGELHLAIERARLHSEATQAERATVAVKLSGVGTRSARGEAAVVLKSLNFKPGDTLTYRVRVIDTRPAPQGPNEAWTPSRSLQIVEKAEPLLARQQAAERQELQSQLDTIKKEAAENRHETEQLRYAADAALRGNGQWDRLREQSLTQRETAARGVADGLARLARDLERQARFQPLARPARQVAELEAEAGRAALDQARRAKDPAQRLTDLQQADSRLAAVQGKIEDLQRRFNELAKRDGDRLKLRDLAERQDDLAGRAQDLSEPPADRARLDQVQAQQEQLKRETEELMKQSPTLRADVLAAQARAAAQLAERIHALAERQHDEARRANEAPRHQALLSALAEAQRTLEDDARRLALEVDPPLSENGRGRLNTEPLARSIEPLQQGDLPRARQQLEEAENELRRLARDLDDVPRDPKALARRLVRRQDQVNNQANELVRVAREKKLSDEQIQGRLKPLAAEQAAIAQLIEPLRVPDPHAEQAREAARRTVRAADDLREHRLPQITDHLREARDALNRLADALPDPWHRQEPARQKLAQARRKTDEVTRELDRHLRETGPQPGKPFDPRGSTGELINRLKPVAQGQDEAIDALAAMDVELRLESQRAHALRSARQLSRLMQAVRDQAALIEHPTAGRQFHPDRMKRLRSALAAVQAEARAALERLEQKMNGRTPADDLAWELAEDERLLQERVGRGRPPDREANAADQRRIATALRGLNAVDQPLAQQEAVRLAEAAALALADAQEPNARELVHQARDAVDALARRLSGQLDPREEARRLAQIQRSLANAKTPPDPLARSERQQAIATAVARLPITAKDRAEDAVGQATELADRAARAGHESPEGAPSAASLTKASKRAADALKALSDQPAEDDGERAAAAPKERHPSPTHVPQDPTLGLNAAHGDAAARLARRERKIREQLQALLGGRIEPQERLRDESLALGRTLADLRDQARDVSPRSHGPAQTAAHLLSEQAPQGMAQAIQQLAQGQAAPALDAQRRAASLLENAAQQVDDLAAALRADQPAEPHDATALDGAREAQRQASRRLAEAREPAAGSAAARAATAQMREAADKLRVAAEGLDSQGSAQASAEAGPPGTQAASGAQPHAAPAGTAATDLAQLQELLKRKTGRTWGELPGHLRTEILQMSQGRYRDDYARLIQLYFREIAAGNPEPDATEDRKP